MIFDRFSTTREHPFPFINRILCGYFLKQKNMRGELFSIIFFKEDE